jgi:ATP-dependent Clp protease adaptor protein ClpS
LAIAQTGPIGRPGNQVADQTIGSSQERVTLLIDHLSSQSLPDTYERLDEQAAQAPLYRVIIHNDEVTPMNFVVHILTSIFRLDGLHALQVMYTAHYHGSAHVQTLPKPEAEKRVGLAQTSARLNRYPLHFTLEAE